MSQQQFLLKAFSTRLYEFCAEHDYYPDECEQLVSQWISGIQKCDRPSPIAVVMNAKRLKWGEELVY